MGSQQDQDIWFIRTRCHKRLGMKGNILCKKNSIIRKKTPISKLYVVDKLEPIIMQQPSNIWKVQHVNNIDFVHLTLKYMKYSTYVCGVNEYPICVCTRYVNVP
jgi:hypothetical protein